MMRTCRSSAERVAGRRNANIIWLEQRLTDLAESTAKALGAEAKVIYERIYPATINHPEQARFAADTAAELVGEDNVVRDLEPSMGAEDFAYMTQQCDGAMFRLGVKPPGAAPRHLHTADFNLDEDALPLGAAMLAATAMRLMTRGVK